MKNLFTTVKSQFCIVPDMKLYDPSKDPKVRRRLKDYLVKYMALNGWSKRSHMLVKAKRLGVTEGVSQANVSNIMTQKEFEPGIYTLRNFAVTLGRPPEELFKIAMGEKPDPNGDEELISLVEIYRTLPESDREYFRRQIQSLIRDMSALDNQP